MSEEKLVGVEKDWLRMVQATDFSRALAEQERARRAEVKGILLDFLEILDSLDRLMAQEDLALEGALVTLRRQLLNAFERAGVRFFESVGRPFDPQRQEAVEARVDSSLEPGSVVEELRRGCEWQGDLLRTAQVVVVKEQP
jgi:molecular chaperone GrpE